LQSGNELWWQFVPPYQLYPVVSSLAPTVFAPIAHDISVKRLKGGENDSTTSKSGKKSEFLAAAPVAFGFSG
jgi:hypothetical protein